MRRDDTPRLQKLKSTNSKTEIRDTETQRLKGERKNKIVTKRQKLKGKSAKWKDVREKREIKPKKR